MIKVILTALCVCAFLSGCDQFLARNFGGTQTIELEQNERLVNVTWKKDSLWVLTKLDSTTQPTTYEFKESALFGVMEGTVRIVEK